MKEKTNRSPVCKERELLPSHLQDGIQGGCFEVFPQTKRNFKNSQACVPVWVLRCDTRITKITTLFTLIGFSSSTKNIVSLKYYGGTQVPAIAMHIILISGFFF